MQAGEWWLFRTRDAIAKLALVCEVIGLSGTNDFGQEEGVCTSSESGAFAPQVSNWLNAMCVNIVREAVFRKRSVLPKTGGLAMKALAAIRT